MVDFEELRKQKKQEKTVFGGVEKINNFNDATKNSKPSPNNSFNAVEKNSKQELSNNFNDTSKNSKNTHTVEIVENSEFSKNTPLNYSPTGATNIFEISGKKGGTYQVAVYDGFVEIKKPTTKHTLKASYSIKEYIMKIKNDQLLKVPKVTLDAKPNANIGAFVLKAVKKHLTQMLTQAFDIVEYVKKNYPAEWESINKDPIAWVLEKSESRFVGGEKYKIGVLHSIVSSRIAERDMKVNFLLIAESGAGKSSSIKSVLDLLPDANWIHRIAKLTPESLAYLPTRNIDGHILFVEEMDHLEYFRNLKKLLTEGRFETWATMKSDEGKLKTQRIVITGIPVFISTTAMLKKWDEEVEQILTRMVTFIFKQDFHKSKRYVLTKSKDDYPEEWKLVFYAWLITRKTAKLTPEVIDAIDRDLDHIVDKAKGAINRMALIYGQLVVAHAMIYGREQTTMEDYLYVKQHFALELYLNSLLLNERDIEIMRALKEQMRASDLAQMLNITKSDAVKELNLLAEKGVVDYDVVDNKKLYYVTELGKEVLQLFDVEDEDASDVVITTTNGGYIADPKFWKKHIYEKFGFASFAPEEFATTIKGMTADEAQKLLQQLVEVGIVGVAYSKDGKPTGKYALAGGGVLID